MNFITDRFSLPTKREFTPEGYLIVKDSKLARTGVLQYRAMELPQIQGIPSSVKPTDVVRVFRGPEELFRDSTLESFKSKPMTLKHPEDFVNASNVKDTNVGFAKDDIRQEDDFMVGSLVISDKEAIDKVKSGVKELSLGYTADIIWQPSVTDSGEQYDAVQRGISGNHIAIVPRGRCGSSCKISDNQSKEGSNMEKVIIDGIEYDCPAQTAQAVSKILDTNEKMKAKVEEAEEAKKKAEDEKEEAEKLKDETQAKLDEAEASKMKDSDLDSLVEERANLIASASKVVKDFDGAGKSTLAIKKEVVQDRYPELDLEGKSDVYVEARFDAILDSASLEKKPSAMTNALKDHAGGSATIADSGLSKSELARQKRIEDNRKKRRGES